eukprot:6184559-Pleurochrysis_carterae.AAC.5
MLSREPASQPTEAPANHPRDTVRQNVTRDEQSQLRNLLATFNLTEKVHSGGTSIRLVSELINVDLPRRCWRATAARGVAQGRQDTAVAVAARASQACSLRLAFGMKAHQRIPGCLGIHQL